MKEEELFDGFADEKELMYSQEARLLYGEDEVSATDKRWKNFSAQEKSAIKAEGQAIYQDMARLLEQGQDPNSLEVQQIVARWHQHLRYFYEPSLERLSGLGRLYTQSPDFSENFNRIRAGLPEYLNRAIQAYCLDKR